MEWIPGAIIYAKPTGNNARHNKGPVLFEVVKMKRRYVELKEVGSSRTDNYLPETGKTKSDCNAGYVFYQDEDAYTEAKDLDRKKRFVDLYFEGLGSSAITDDQYSRVYDILKENK